MYFCFYRTSVECAGTCLASNDCYGFQWNGIECKGFRLTGLCLDDKKVNPISVYVDNNNLPPVCIYPCKCTKVMIVLLIFNILKIKLYI